MTGPLDEKVGQRMKVGTTLELIVLVVVILGMIYLVQPDPPQDTTETVVAAPARPALQAPRAVPPPPVLLPDRSRQTPAPETPTPATSFDLVDIGIGCVLFGGAAAGVAYFVVPAQLVAFATGVAAAPGPGPAALTPGSAIATMAPALAVGCAAGAMVLPMLTSLFTGEEPRAEEFAVALDRARTTFGVTSAVQANVSLLAPDERPTVIHVGTYAFSDPK